MAKIKLSPLFTSITGSIGRSTFQRSLGGTSLRSKPLKSPALSQPQQVSKSYMSLVIAAWHNVPESTRQLWAQYALYNPHYQEGDRTRQLSGYNLFVKYNCIRLAAGLDVLESTDFVAPDKLTIDPVLYSLTKSTWVAAGEGDNTLAYSYDGIDWIGLGFSVFNTSSRAIACSGAMWLAGGSDNNTLAYSYDGIDWIGLGKTIFSVCCYGIAWNGTMWVAVGSGINSIAYSYNGINWTGLGHTIFDDTARAIAWNGTMWLAGGGYNNTLAYSYNGINWYELGTILFDSYCHNLAWNGYIWVAVGEGDYTIAYSYDGFNWTGLGYSIFDDTARAIAWNGTMWIAGGASLNTLAYSYDGINWFGLGKTIFTDVCFSIAWNGIMFVASGSGANALAYSYDGFDWIGIDIGSPFYFSHSIASFPAPNLYPAIIPPVIIFNFNADIQAGDCFAMLKLSPAIRPTSAYRPSILRVIKLNFLQSNPFNISDSYLAVFFRSLQVYDTVDCEITLFSLTDGKVFPSQYFRLIVE